MANIRDGKEAGLRTIEAIDEVTSLIKAGLEVPGSMVLMLCAKFRELAEQHGRLISERDERDSREVLTPGGIAPPHPNAPKRGGEYNYPEYRNQKYANLMKLKAKYEDKI